MPQLSLYRDARGRTALHESGFSWSASCVLPLWMLRRDMRWMGVATLMAQVAVGEWLWQLTDPWPAMFGFAALHLGLAGALANRWHGWLLRHRGYRRVAGTPEAATHRPGP